MSNVQKVLEAITAKPGTIDELAERLGITKAQAQGAVSQLSAADKISGEKTDGKGKPKRWSIGAGAAAAPKAGKRKKKKSKKKSKRVYKSLAQKYVKAKPVEFHCGITADRSLIVVDPELLQVRRFDVEQTSQLADLFLAHFEAGAA